MGCECRATDAAKAPLARVQLITPNLLLEEEVRHANFRRHHHLGLVPELVAELVPELVPEREPEREPELVPVREQVPEQLEPVRTEIPSKTGNRPVRL